MRKLTAAQIKVKHELATELQTLTKTIQGSIDDFNAHLTNLSEQLVPMTERYNELVQAANTFIQSVHEGQEAFIGDKTDRWSDSDAGTVYTDWADEWTLELEELTMDLPDTLDDIEREDAELLQELPNQA